MGSLASGPHVTPDHQGPRVDIAVWVCFVVSGLAVTAKVLTKLSRSQRHIRLTNLGLDDLFLSASFVSPKPHYGGRKLTTADFRDRAEHCRIPTSEQWFGRAHNSAHFAAAPII
jgi:hypothetical protein